MLRRHLDVPVYEDSIRPLRCGICGGVMDNKGDHATGQCRKGYGFTHRHNAVVRVFGREVFGKAGLAVTYEEPLLIPGANNRPADIYVQPSPPAPGTPPDKPIAYDVTIRCPYRNGMTRHSAVRSAGAAEQADAEKRATLERTLRDAYHVENSDSTPGMPWKFIPLAFDLLGAPSAQTQAVIESHAATLARRGSGNFGLISCAFSSG